MDESEPAPNEVLRTLDDGGVPKSHVRVIRSPPSDALKVDLINSLVNSLPRKRSWFIYADVDELFDYPCGQNLRQHPCVAGSMWDQMAANGNISEMRISSSTWVAAAVGWALVCRRADSSIRIP